MVKLNMKENLKMIKKFEMENIIGEMENFIKGNGKMIINMVMELYIIKMMNLNMRVNLSMVKKKEKENLFIKVVIIMRDISQKIKKW